LLEAAGKTPPDMVTEVNHFKERAADARQLATLPALQAEKTELERKGTAEVARFEAAVKPLKEEHAKNMRGVNNRYREVVAAIPQVEALREKLRRSYVGPLTIEFDDVRMKQGEVGRKIGALLKTAAKHEHAASFTRREESSIQVVRERGELVGVVAESLTWDKMSTLKDTPILPCEELDTLQAAAKACREQAAELQKQLDVLIAREAEILELMLLP